MDRPSPGAIESVQPDQLQALLADGSELALLDARDQGLYGRGHVLEAVSVPRAELELRLDRLLPRPAVKTIWCDQDGADGGAAIDAATTAVAQGWQNQQILAGGLDHWMAHGGPVVEGLQSLAAGAIDEIGARAEVPQPSAAALWERMTMGDLNLVVLDTRNDREFQRRSIPGSISCPGVELLDHFAHTVTDPTATVVVVGADRTGGIVGAHTLTQAGVSNPVVALADGMAGWLAANLPIEPGRQPEARPAGRSTPGNDIGELVHRFGGERIDLERLSRWADDQTRTTYVIDVRRDAEFRSGHLADSIHVPGARLIESVGEHLAVRNARVVLVDDTETRAVVTAAWLRRLGWGEAVALAGGLAAVEADGGRLVTGKVARPRVTSVPTIKVSALAARLPDAAETLAVLDVGTSVKYRTKGHIPGSWWGMRSRLDQARAAIGPVDTVVLTSTDGLLAKLAAADAVAHWPEAEVLALAGGNKGWRHGGHDMEPGFTRPTTEPDDVWFAPDDPDDPDHPPAPTTAN